MSSAPRAEASANAASVALRETSEPSTPITTGPYLVSSVTALSSRTTTTEQFAWETTDADTDPMTMPVRPPMPREPMTIVVTSFDISSSMSMGEPSAMVCPILMSGATSRAISRAASIFSEVSACSSSKSSCGGTIPSA